MSEAAKAPSAVTEAAAQSATLPSPAASDPAPPPTSTPPTAPAPVPPRTYPKVPVYLAPPPAYAPNSTVPNFLRIVAVLVLIGGTASSAIAWTIVYPRLVIALQARTRLFRSHETIYAKLHDTIVGLVNAAGIRRLGGAEAVEFRKRRERERRTLSSEQKAPSAKLESGDVNEEKKPLLPTGAADAQEETAPSEGQVEPHATEPLPPAPRILEPVKTSLTSLRAELASGSPSASTSSTGGHMTTNPSNLVQPQGMLMRSLVTLNEYLESESYAAATFHTYRPYGAYGASAGSSSTATGERKALQEVTHNFKAEIRSIKGALLNRRNFARPETVSS
ncbi:hypothetical protein RHOSPDRAFT_31389 [Rhodotorula sp. JG-1b]|nr:hypothetical protein RHOSPDRAFT_31389 [Rhodotorula sp. JG-1b]